MKGQVAALLCGIVGLAVVTVSTVGQTPKKPAGVIPHAQDKPPGPALTPAEAIKKMTVPQGFSVELVASEPDLVNPVAMTFDERGRIWITESLEYPRLSAGPGRDRIKVFEDTDGDGTYEKVTIFAEGLNIPSGIAVGHGGVWVANSPDILFLQDTDGDGKADNREIVVTGFGRKDTHELPNSLTWGPDGWLYGLNGVFNDSHVNYRGKEHHFTCTLFRIHPRTREFELFAEGTSNPWGVAWDSEGSAFVSACVIDHLWHLTETGYYHRQGGPYPPFTWKLESIVKHKHQKAAYCGIHYFDSDAYPSEYRDRLYMGNIHGGCINVDVLERDGSTYFAKPAPDFLTANDAWFMPVVQKTGPDGCLYILDWYDRYHCYQDARRDPEGIDRGQGRLYRVRYKDSPRAGRFDLARESDDQLIQRLHSPNVLFRDLAQRLLFERNNSETRSKLQQLVLKNDAPRKARMHALWSLVSMGPLDTGFHQQILNHGDASFRAWAVRAAANAHRVDNSIRQKVVALAQDSSPDVRLQVAIATRKIEGIDAIAVLTQIQSTAGPDKLIPSIVWQNLHPLLEEQAERFVAMVQTAELKDSPHLAAIVPRAVERMIASRKSDSALLAILIGILLEEKSGQHAAAKQCLTILANKLQSGEIVGGQREKLREHILPLVQKVLNSKNEHPLAMDAALLATTLKDQAGFARVRQMLLSRNQNDAARLQALDALIAANDAAIVDAITQLMTDRKTNSAKFRGQLLGSLGRMEDARIGSLVLKLYPQMEPELQPKALELLTQRAEWSKPLLEAIAAKKIPAAALNVNQVRKLQASKDPEISRQVKAHWGVVREERNPERERIVGEMRKFLRSNEGDPKAGMVVFKNVCAQCHKIYGEGLEVGPEITENGRSDFDQLLSNVFDPSLVIGAAYQATTVVTANGQIISGLVVEDNAQRLVLKQQGGKLETIARKDVDEVRVSNVSLMPEGLEKQLKPQEIVDLFAFLILDRPPNDPQAKRIKGAP